MMGSDLIFGGHERHEIHEKMQIWPVLPEKLHAFRDLQRSGWLEMFRL